MIRGEKVGLRAQREDDVPILHEELYEDVATRSRADNRPWRPLPPSRSPLAAGEPSDSFDVFAVVELASGELAGEAVLWDVSTHQRRAHLGLALRPAFRGRGLGSDTVRALCVYGFDVRGLRRLQIETLADNRPMLAAARSVGFTHEGTLRRAAWACGREIDEAVLGLLADEWAGRPDAASFPTRHDPAT